MCEAFARLSAFYPVSQFQYVGYGSTSFADFVLVHRMLGIFRMVSIERQEQAKARFRLNAPFDCIDIKFGESTDVLPDIDLKSQSIIWLDDDQALTKSVLRDINYVIASMAAPSVFVISVNASPWSELAPDPKIASKRLEKLKEAVGEGAIPPSTTGISLQGWGTARVYYEIIADAIKSAAADRAVVDGTVHKQLFHFRYQDGAKMLTVGGVLLRAEDAAAFDAAGFEKLFFVRNSAEPFHIKVPVLTFREMRYLDQLLPEGRARLPEGLFPESDVDEYAVIYRYFPLYAETDL